jgi:hypothetical protein
MRVLQARIRRKAFGIRALRIVPYVGGRESVPRMKEYGFGSQSFARNPLGLEVLNRLDCAAGKYPRRKTRPSLCLRHRKRCRLLAWLDRRQWSMGDAL